MSEHDYDVIVIGAGAAGGIVAGVLAEAGRSVLLLERGRDQRAYEQVGRDHLRNHRLPAYGHNTGPDLDGHPRVVIDPKGRPHVRRPHEGGYHNNAMTVGGGTRVYGGMAWRFLPRDFRMASVYGVPAGSSLADWPIDYDELAPWYERAEWEVGVAGRGGSNACEGARARDYPMPPWPPTLSADALRRGADALGINTFPPPMLINTRPYLGRDACGRCGRCVGFACPTDGKNGSQNTLLPRALATGRCRLVCRAIAERVETDAKGRATGVRYWVEQDDEEPTLHAARARAVVACGGAIESARLLLNSATHEHHRGLGNDHDLVGRNLQGHVYPNGHGLFDEVVFDNLGPGPAIATCAYNHGNPGGIIGGAMIADDFIKLPVIFQKWSLPPGAPRWGLAAKRMMREHYARTIDLKGPVQEVPTPEARVTVDRDATDKFGIPVARLSGAIHPETIRTAQFIRDRAIAWLKASGAKQTWGFAPSTPYLSGGQHQAGTCRMGDDPRTSVCDPWGRVHGHDNLFVIDGSLHVTNGGFNPVLTIMALAFRNAGHVAASL